MWPCSMDLLSEFINQAGRGAGEILEGLTTAAHTHYDICPSPNTNKGLGDHSCHCDSRKCALMGGLAPCSIHPSIGRRRLTLTTHRRRP